ncbi:MAG: hypothetical protein ABI318_10670 [Chthoniobacteraceae bacterium]
MNVRAPLHTAALLLMLALIATAGPRLAPPEELPAAIAWFNGLTIPDVAGKPYVEVVRQRYPSTGGKLHEDKQRGFLIAEDEKTWTLVPDGTAPPGKFWPLPRAMEKLWEMRVTKPHGEPLPGASPDKRPLDLREVAAEICAAAAVDVEAGNNPSFDRYNRAGGCSAVFVLARFCERNGLADAARDLDRAALSLPLETSQVYHRDPANPRRDRVFSLRENIEWELGWVLLRRTLATFADESVSRSELLTRMDQLVREFPGMEGVEQARKLQSTLRRMVEEDARHLRTEKEIESLAPAAQANEWIFRLCDQTEQKHGMFASGGKVGIIEPGAHAAGARDYQREDRRPAQQLLSLGHAAVPALIEALSDTRLTRTLQYSNFQPTLPEVITVADCAEEILERISGRSFWWERVSAKGGAERGTPADGRPAVEKWWRDLNERGENAGMAEAIRRGDQSSWEQARRLFARDPAAAAAALPAGIGNAQTPWIRVTLVEQLARVPGDGALTFLRGEMAHGRWVQSRVAAARVLHRRGGEEAVTAMLGEWRRWEPVPGAQRHSADDTADSLADFLIAIGRADGVRALAARFDEVPIAVRVMILEKFQRGHDSVSELARFEPPWALGEQPSLRAAKLAAEDFLLRALDDRSLDTEMNYGGGTGPSWQARVCDHAAGALLSMRNHRWIGPGEASIAARDALIARLKATAPQKPGDVKK